MHILISNLKTALWIVVPICLIIGWFMGSFKIDEFSSDEFDYHVFFIIFIGFFVWGFISTYITLVIGSIIKIKLTKTNKHNLVSKYCSIVY